MSVGLFSRYVEGVRFLDPLLGRFTQMDPVREAISHYLYVRDIVTSGIDPGGLLSSGFCLMMNKRCKKFVFEDTIDCLRNCGALNAGECEITWKSWAKNIISLVSRAFGIFTELIEGITTNYCLYKCGKQADKAMADCEEMYAWCVEVGKRGDYWRDDDWGYGNDT